MPDSVADGRTDSLIAIDPVTGDRTIVSWYLKGSGTNFYSPTDVIADYSTGNHLVLDTYEYRIFEVDPLPATAPR